MRRREVDRDTLAAHHDAMPKRILLALLCVAVAALALLLLCRDGPSGGATTATTATARSDSPEVATGDATKAAAGRVEAANTPRVSPPRSGQGIRGRVVDGAGKPIASAEVSAFARSSTDPFALQSMRSRGLRHASMGRATSAHDGSFAIELDDACADARIEAHVRAASFAPGQTTCSPRVGEWSDVGDVALGRGRTLRGTVRDALTEMPIAGAEVAILLPSTRMLDLPPLSATTDAQGAYAIDNAPVGICNIAASADDHARHELPQQHIQRDEENVLDFALQPGRTLTGFVVDSEGRACDGAFVRATPAAARDTGTVGAHARADGSFRIEGVALGQAELVASAPGFGTARATADADATRPVTLQLMRLARVRVVAHDQDGRPVVALSALARGAGGAPSASMRRIGPKTATALEDGAATLELEGLDAGEWIVEASAPGFARCASGPFPVESGERREVTLTLTKGSRVVGRVVDERGSPVGGALVRLLPDGALDGDLGAALRAARASVGAAPFAYSKVDGSFVVERVHDGAHQFGVARDGFAPRIVRGIRTTGADAQLGDIALARGAAIRGRALAAGTVDRRVVVQLAPIDAQDVAPDFVAECRVDAEGKFRFEGLARGRYALLAGRRDADDPFLENSDQTRSRVEVEADSAAARAVDLEVAPR